MNSWNGNERNLLFTNLGDSKFSDVGRPLGCDEIEESRGVAIADLNKDGKLDIVINNNAAAPTIYLNQCSGQGNFFRCTLRSSGGGGEAIDGRSSSRDALGARVEVDIAQRGEIQTLIRYVEAGSGYAAQSEMTLHFGLGNATTIKEIRTMWPSGNMQTIAGPRTDLVNREWIIDEGSAPVEVSLASGRDDRGR